MNQGRVPASGLKILEIITVPFFEARGTGFSSLERTKALSRMGHRVDVLAYSLGEPVEIDQVRVHRIPKVPFIRAIRMGPSLKKLILDLLLAAKTYWWLLARGPFDVVHVHEEAAYWVALAKPFFRGRMLYDMHSSLVEQLDNFGYRRTGITRRIFQWLEQLALTRSDGIIVICPELESLVMRTVPNAPVQLIENLPVGWDQPQPSEDEVDSLRTKYQLHGKQVVLYTGSFGKNQGLEMALDAMKQVCRTIPEARLLLVGGTGQDLDRVRSYARSIGLESSAVLFAGSQPHTTIPAYSALADVLISPRTEGTNTPLKIYSYMASGKPIVATRLWTHTQVLSDDNAELVDANANAFAEGIARVLNDPAHADRLGRRAQDDAQQRYGIDRYMQQLANVINMLVPPSASQEDVEPEQRRATANPRP